MSMNIQSVGVTATPLASSFAISGLIRPCGGLWAMPLDDSRPIAAAASSPTPRTCVLDMTSPVRAMIADD
jgi:hypothetical protein